MATNRAVAYMGPRKLEIQNLDFPKLVDPRGKTCDHGVILKIVTTNICGSDQHIYRGRFPAPKGMILGHENTGEVIEVGRDVEFLKKGDLVSVPFNVACGRCRNCRERHTEVCMNVNPEVACGAYGFNLGGWQGGQADYMMVPYADFAAAEVPRQRPGDGEDQGPHPPLGHPADRLPRLRRWRGSGRGPRCTSPGPGRWAGAPRPAPACWGRPASSSATRTRSGWTLVKKAGYEVVDLSKNTPLPDQIEAILGEREVDCGVDCVGFEAHGYGPASAEDDPAAVLNGLFEVVRAPAGMGIPGIYTAGDPEAKTEAGQTRHLRPRLRQGVDQVAVADRTGQCPVMKYNRDLMMAILWDRMDYLSEVMNIEVIPLEKAPEAYRIVRRRLAEEVRHRSARLRPQVNARTKGDDHEEPRRTEGGDPGR